MTNLSWQDNNSDETFHEIYVSTGNIPDNLTGAIKHWSIQSTGTNTTGSRSLDNSEQAFDTITFVSPSRYSKATGPNPTSIYLNSGNIPLVGDITSHPFTTNDRVLANNNTTYYIHRVGNTEFKLKAQIDSTTYVDLTSITSIRLIEPFINYRIAALRGTGANTEIALSGYWPMFNPSSIDAPRFKFVIRIDNDNQPFTLPITAGLAYKFAIDWGDNTRDYYNLATGDTLPFFNTHTYALAAEYTVTIVGLLQGFRFNNSSSAKALIRVNSWGQMKFNPGGSGGGGYFYGCTNLESIPVTTADNVSNLFIGTADDLDFNNFFRDCTKFNSDISNWTTTRANTMHAMFMNCTNFNKNLNSWNTNNVTNMSYMFYGCSKFNGNITSWNTAKVTDMKYMFTGAHEFNQNIGNWNVGNVTNMEAMFKSTGVIVTDVWNGHYTYSIFTLPSNKHKFNQDIGNWNVEKVTIMLAMFEGAADFNKNISNWKTIALTNASRMFVCAFSFNQSLPAVVNDQKWNMSSVSDMSYMFNNATAFQGNEVSTWKVNGLTSGFEMFTGSGLTNNNYNSILTTWPGTLTYVTKNVYFAADGATPSSNNRSGLLNKGWYIKDASTGGLYTNV